MLTSYCCRWKKINITALFSFNRFAAVKGSPPILTELVIALNEVPSTDALTIFENTPRLNTVVVKSSYFPMQLPWAQLQVYSAVHISIKECLAILKCCPNLRRCWFAYGVTNEAAAFTTLVSPLICSKLRELHISIRSETVFGYIFDSITCPALDHLFMEEDYTETLRWAQDLLSSFLARSFCMLRRLTLRHISLNYPNLIACLECLPSLVELNIRECAYSTPSVVSNLFDRMTYHRWSMTGVQPVLVPRLKALSLNINLAPDGDVLQEMIQSRWNLMQQDDINEDAQGSSVARLEYVYLAIAYEADDEKFARMRSWRDEGLDIHITVAHNRCVCVHPTISHDITHVLSTR